jgi:hypothetical protein
MRGAACAAAALFVDAQWWYSAWPIAIAGAGVVAAVVAVFAEVRRRPAVAWQPVLAGAVCGGVVLAARSQLDWIAQFAN